MIDCWLHLTPAVNLFLDGPNPTGLNRDHTLNAKHTDVTNNICFFLSFFNVTQETLACEKTPTLPFVLPSIEALISALHYLPKKGYGNLMHAVYTSIKKLEKYREECRSSHLYMLAMGMYILLSALHLLADCSVLHPGVKLHWLADMWSDEELDEARNVTLAAVSLNI